ncbi:MAG TPA: hypothetical protein VN765_07305 [Candidatus Acidoferrum sp.]|nr:hypothetical protein [Candidatus Acidoferrum sp.]
MKVRIKRVILAVLFLLGGFILLLVLGVGFLWWRFPVHQHCIKGAGTEFRLYSGDHEGRFPFSTNGFGDALLLMAKSRGDDASSVIAVVTGVGDDGGAYRKALTNGTHLAETNCSRIYVQGLTRESNPQIAMLFDAYPTHGGDHFRRPWGPLVREVCLVDGSMQIIPEAGWPAFAKKQIELLVASGISRTNAEKYYKLATVKHSQY